MTTKKQYKLACRYWRASRAEVLAWGDLSNDEQLGGVDSAAAENHQWRYDLEYAARTNCHVAKVPFLIMEMAKRHVRDGDA